MTEQSASANDTGMTSEQIMTAAQTDACYLVGILEGIDMLLDSLNDSESKATNAIYSLVVVAKEKADELNNRLDSINIGRAS
ncbi:hypothetical protein [Tropicimonas sp. IMCC6043]|uniref:hypothetical protein n=1 Tax=Tropicimonas sp. IMCC6043 TaxID=2510645 RepID=UPI00101CA817|nr:hypothetical protein [Tropicimonas sp. IMCC6043]RYH08887.1 hypothetical protein EU800_14215 [Tropicimonas sp. IMCC6043]